MRVLDLFSGIGGFSLGLERAGMQTVAFCEIEPYCRKILRKHWPYVPIHDDIRNLDGSQYRGTIDLICGGYPCQPFSVAGKQKGQQDNRHLWPSMLEIIQTCRPRWVIAENVTGHVRLGLDKVLFDLEASGYTSQPIIIPACAVNAPHRRDRVWVLGYTEHDGSSSPEICREFEKTGRGSQKGPASPLKPSGTDRPTNHEVMADTTSERVQRHRPGRQQKPYTPAKKELSGRRGERSFTASWETEPGVGRVVDGLPHRVDRIKALGNAVVPQIPEIIGRYIMQIDQNISD